MTEENQPSQAEQDYLKAIYSLTRGVEGRATTMQLAERLAVRPASVTGMVRKLAEAGWIEYEKRKGVRLTANGRLAALRVIRRHRLIETFLHAKLGYSWDEVHAEAENLEHAISTEMSQRMADLLGNPRHDPHGDPIPTRTLDMPEKSRQRLCDLNVGETGRILRVPDRDPALLRHLASLGLVPGALCSRVADSDAEAGMLLRIDEQTAAQLVTHAICRQLLIERI